MSVQETPELSVDGPHGPVPEDVSATAAEPDGEVLAHDLVDAPEADDRLEANDQPDPEDWPDPDEVRERLLKILEDARGVENLPWKSARLSLYRLLYVQMTLRLPDDEGERLRAQLEEEMQRLEAA